MPATIPTLTQRLFLRYTSAFERHTLMLRPPGVQPESTLESMAAAAATQLADYMLDIDSFTAAEYTGVGSNVRFPLAFTPVAGTATIAGNQYAEDPESVQLSLTGKCLSSGIRWHLDWFSSYNFAGSVWPGKNRWQFATAPTGVSNLFITINSWYGSTGLAGQQLVGAGSQHVIFNSWINICRNGYWQRKQR